MEDGNSSLTRPNEKQSTARRAGEPPHNPPSSDGDAGSQHKRPWLRWLAWTIGALVLLVALALGAAWVWTGSSGSLAFVLERAAPYLPAGQQLQTQGVTGSLRSGGHIDRLVWQSEGLDVVVKDVDIGWSLKPLLDKKVALSKVDIASVVLTPKPTPDKVVEPITPLEKLELPIQIDVPFAIARIVWAGPPEQVVQSLEGRYRYDGTDHLLDLAGVDLPQGHVQGKVRLQGAAPMALKAQLDAKLSAPMPEDGPALDVTVAAKADGTLSGEAALIQVDAELQQVANTAPATAKATESEPGATTAMQAQVTAKINPWAKQPLASAEATLNGVDAAALVAGAPRTLLSGSVAAGPTEDGWAIDAKIKNAVPGPADKGAVPVESADLQARFDGSVWTLPQALVRAGEGTIALRGTFTPETQAFDAEAEVTRLNPSYLHTQLEAAPVGGTASAKGTAQDVAFNVALTASGAQPNRSASAAVNGPLRIDRIVANGRWKDGILTMPSVEVDALQAQVRASKVHVVTGNKLSVEAKVDAAVPGAKLAMDGRIAETTGKGDLQVQLRDAQEMLNWLRKLPAMSQVLEGLAARGTANLNAQWNGGWSNLAAIPSGKAPAAKGTAATTAASTSALATGINARLSTPRLQLELPQGDGVGALKVDARDVLLTANGNASKADISLKADVLEGKRRLSLNTSLQAGIEQASGGKSFSARADVEKLALRALDGIRKGAWTVKLDSPVSINYTKSEVGAMTINAGAASAVVGAPVPGNVALKWQPVVFTQTATGAFTLQSKGSISDVPIAWTDLAVAEPEDSPLRKLGVDTNLVFGAQWDVNAADTLSAQVKLQRTSGDVRIALDGDAPTTSTKSTGAKPDAAQNVGTANTISAGIKTMDVTVSATGNDVRAELVWDTARAGVVRAEVATQLARADGGWKLPDNAPLSGKVRAQLPQLGVLSVLAPPGWRINGALDADVALSGTIPDPRWSGTLRADKLAVQSLLDGVDLRNGNLVATLAGNRVDVTQFHLEGSSASSARIVGFSGNLTPPPTDGGSLDGSGRVQWGTGAADGPDGDGSLRMNFKVRAKSLQVLARADRQASISGTLDASLADRQFKLRGDLKIDRASITLPEAGAPTLGDDVVVRSKAIDKKAQKALEKQIKDETAAAADAAAAAAKGSRTQTALAPDVQVALDLGNDFALQGFGIKSRLEGKLTIRGAAKLGAPPTVVGEIRTVAGRYRAWGQALDVEKGLITFSGPYDNPLLDILALRANIEVRAGVAVTGTAKNPQVRLYSDPQLPDAEKLSWVVLGRSTASGGAEAAVLQQAALALLSGGDNTDGNIASKFGLDEIGFKGPGEDASGAALTFGKRLSKDLYVTYEKSLSGTLGSLYIFYDLTKRLRLRGQTGADTGLALIYTVRYE